MKYYFEDPEKQIELGRELESWIGTPFRHWAGVKGMGTDCIHFVVRVMESMGVRSVDGSFFDMPRYQKDWHLHNDAELLLFGVLQQAKVSLQPLRDPMNGDVFLFQFGRVCSHAAIYYEGRLYQAIAGQRVSKLPFEAVWHKRKRFNYRVLV